MANLKHSGLEPRSVASPIDDERHYELEGRKNGVQNRFPDCVVNGAIHAPYLVCLAMKPPPKSVVSTLAGNTLVDENSKVCSVPTKEGATNP